jgi:peptidoglycan/LPS O-acetylase OafA/YrhL
MAVDFFFVLSGFVMARVYADGLVDDDSAARFIVRRIGRLWPLHVTMLALFVLVECLKLGLIGEAGFTSQNAAFGPARPPSDILPIALFLQTARVGPELTWNFPSWSISAEVWTYAVFALVSLRTAGDPVRRALYAGTIALAAWLALAYGNGRGMISTDIYGIVRCFLGFFTGVLAEWLHRRGSVSTLADGRAELSTALVAAMLLYAVVDAPALRFLAPVVFMVLVIAHAEDRGPLSRLLSSRPMQWLGQLSYSIYLSHLFVAAYVVPRLSQRIDLLMPDAVATREVLVAVIYLGIVLGLSSLTWRYIEQPGQRVAARIAASLGRGQTLSSRYSRSQLDMTRL